MSSRHCLSSSIFLKNMISNITAIRYQISQEIVDIVSLSVQSELKLVPHTLCSAHRATCVNTRQRWAMLEVPYQHEPRRIRGYRIRARNTVASYAPGLSAEELLLTSSRCQNVPTAFLISRRTSITIQCWHPLLGALSIWQTLLAKRTILGLLNLMVGI